MARAAERHFAGSSPRGRWAAGTNTRRDRVDARACLRASFLRTRNKLINSIGRRVFGHVRAISMSNQPQQEA
jgi:hypothetical protein